MEKYNIQMKCGQAINYLYSPFFFDQSCHGAGTYQSFDW